jgi:hypothetical protein
MKGHLTRTVVRIALRVLGRGGRSGKSRIDSATDEWERLALLVLREKGPLPLNALIECIADQAMLRDQLEGGGDVDIALWGKGVYRQEAASAVRRMLGRSLVLEGEGPWLLAHPAA